MKLSRREAMKLFTASVFIPHVQPVAIAKVAPMVGFHELWAQSWANTLFDYAQENMTLTELIKA